jgi:hypothetical protein
MYSEMVYFDGAHFAHLAHFHEHLRLERIRMQAEQGRWYPPNTPPSPARRASNAIVSPG